MKMDIKEEINDLKEYYIKPLSRQVDNLQGQIFCLKGNHQSQLNGDKLTCARCSEVLGKVVPNNYECKAPEKSKEQK